MSHPLTSTDMLRRWMLDSATATCERTGRLPSIDELAADADAECPGSLDLLDVEDLAHDVLELLRKYPPGRARLAEVARA